MVLEADQGLDKKLDHVPGTVLLNDEASHAAALDQGLNLKHGKGRNSHIVLSPQPSDDPNDPLNWSSWKKEVIVAILCLGAMLNAGTNVSGAVQGKGFGTDYCYRGLSLMPRTLRCLSNWAPRLPAW